MSNDSQRPADEDMSDRRGYERARLILDIKFDGEELTGVANSRDISLGGLYMNTRANLPQGARLSLRIPFGAASEAIVEAEVMYANPGIGAGLRFLEVDEHARQVLERELARD